MVTVVNIIIVVTVSLNTQKSFKNSNKKRNIELYCCSSTFSGLLPASLDVVMTDPTDYAN